MQVTAGTPALVTRQIDPGILVDADARRLLDALTAPGEATRIVGGAVRNLLLGMAIADIDLATTLLPRQVERLAGAAGLKSVPTGIEHGTITLIVRGRPFEVTTLRADVETDGRHAKVVFGRDFAADALRRDFTINALSMDADGMVYDYTGGLADLADRRVRFIGDARQRIREDYLRTLRFFRFHAAYGAGPLDRAGFDGAVAEREGLARLSRERVRSELLKLLAAPNAVGAITEMADAGLLGSILGGVAVPARLARLAAIEASLGRSPDGLLRLAALSVQVREDAERLRDVLRLSRAETARLDAAAVASANLHQGAGPPDEPEAAALLFRHGRVAALDALALTHAQARASIDDPRWLAAARWLATAERPEFPISGADILAHGMRGNAVGAVLKRLQARWIRAGFPRDAQALSQLVEESIAAVRGEGT